ncbi:tRNA lysidine(34) synthetase TilS [Algoriphagus confluentis]|uniref:tRNA(Ile)-lysidine synthase n=1 Tax=Algoriphagus confluentis TaxID=1697556 RepID=A0ABQ6PK10_9BACT|nr:tRNA lysidine(34) synthetase TilS [Algoriphagus confluentis]
MLDQFTSEILPRLDLKKDEHYLLGFSGGVDSVCLAHLLWKSGIHFELAHVNFGLRGEESDQDATFAAALANAWGVPFHLHHGATHQLAKQKGISIQMAAREIRYDFFEKIRSQNHLHGIFLAHHEDDQLETVVLNLLRGTGIEGIYGMAEKKGWLIRPLLTFSKNELLLYAKLNQLEWREDSSNTKADYKRNKLRLEVLPALYAVADDARKNLLTSFSRVKDTGKAFSGLFEDWKSAHVQVAEDWSFLPYSSLQYQAGGGSLLYFWLRPYGFQPDQVYQIFSSLQEPHSGKGFYSPSHWVNLDRDGIYLASKPKEFFVKSIERGISEIQLPEGHYLISETLSTIPMDFSSENAQLDADLLEFPLVIRPWQEGDRFMPLGMNSEKKISDFLIDSKVPLIKKQHVKVMVSGGKIAWVLGFRIAEWAKRGPSTRKVIYFKKN